jgi:DNA polymerase III psi subunit
MSRLAPAADPLEQLRLARALGLKPLRLRGRPRPSAPVRLRIAAAKPFDALLQDPLLHALLKSLDLTADEVGADSARGGLLLAIDREGMTADAALPALEVLRVDATAKRALWPTLRRLRRRLLDA